MPSAGLVIALLAGLMPAPAQLHSSRPPSPCRPAPLILWGDGRHDDTAALNAWFRGKKVVWAESGKAVGPVITGRSFKLSAAIFVPSGTDRTITRFRFVWPWTHEQVAGGTIATGTNPARPAVESGLRKIGGDPLEGVPYAAPMASRSPSRPGHLPPRACLIS
jgi:hypothetical protein